MKQPSSIMVVVVCNQIIGDQTLVNLVSNYIPASKIEIDMLNIHWLCIKVPSL